MGFDSNYLSDGFFYSTLFELDNKGSWIEKFLLRNELSTFFSYRPRTMFMKLPAFKFKHFTNFFRRYRIPESSYGSSASCTAAPNLSHNALQADRSNGGPDETPFSSHAVGGHSAFEEAHRRPPLDHDHSHPLSTHQHQHHVLEPRRSGLTHYQRLSVHLGGHIIFPTGHSDYLLRIEKVIPSSGRRQALTAGEVKIVSPNQNAVLEVGRRVVLMIGNPTGEGNEYIAEVMRRYIVTRYEDEVRVPERRGIAESISIPNATIADDETQPSLEVSHLRDRQVSEQAPGDSSTTELLTTAAPLRRVDKGKAREQNATDNVSTSSLQGIVLQQYFIAA
ncbi:hypothetical protein GGU11DRAFT_65014 [Lentinula aff. detonsa]|nr:hypothetical protein GGU11DRAFT_65014 [Lentinula aff. detonsa]